MEDPFSKQISDPVHGTIELTPLEVRIINTRSFQRLTRIGQLGLVHLVFPGAQYSRFSHSLGVCHVTGRILDSIADTPGFKELNNFDDWKREWQRYRLAGLLHDVGHYPFSHTLENVLEDTYDEEHEGPYAEDDEPSTDGNKQYMEHEAVGACILKHDPEIREILEQEGYAGKVAPIFQRIELEDESEGDNGEENPGIEYADIVSSGLDADRLDYLMRSSRFSGVPYGGIDLDYLISQFQIDPNNRICLTKKARLTADHFLLSRWFEYQQMIYHHTVQAAASTLQDVLQEALECQEPEVSDYLPSCNRRSVKDMISDGKWPDFDDNRALGAIRRLRDETDSNEIQDKCRAILERRLPKVVYENKDFFETQTSDSNSSSPDESLIETLEEEVEGVVDLEVYPISQTNKLPFTKMEAGENLSPEASTSGDHDVRIAKEIKDFDDLENPDDEHYAKLIANDRQTVIKLLSSQERHVLRLYVLFGTDSEGKFPNEMKIEEAREKIDEVVNGITSDWEDD